ncbi:MAG: NADPH-dependent 7-cyano-7-deazaguanine reductase QueF [Planctomycetota bacterium]|nr:MAG: NADPH-dependent 7-cyano-7-deazaguanine reductase QueF [Planctomycetota bacterium]
MIEVFPNPHPDRTYLVESVAPEFTCLCPRTGQPDFATIRVRYAPGKSCFELKSFKLFLGSFRNEGHFHEDVTNRILAELVAAVDPVWMEVRGEFHVRGGIATTVTVRHGTLPAALAGVEPAVWPGPS